MRRISIEVDIWEFPRPPALLLPIPVLVVDDVDATRHGLAELLRLRGYALHEAKNGAEGIELLRENTPDTGVVVMDLTMPGRTASGFASSS
jgi:CheY-like chemotaxis protein